MSMVVFQGHTDELWGLAVHPLKLQFLTCGHDKLVSLWDSESHQPLWTKTLEVNRNHSMHQFKINGHNVSEDIIVIL